MEDIKLIETKRVRISLAWYDIWIGLFIDTDKKKLYICPVPGLLVTIKYGKVTTKIKEECWNPDEQGVYRRVNDNNIG